MGFCKHGTTFTDERLFLSWSSSGVCTFIFPEIHTRGLDVSKDLLFPIWYSLASFFQTQIDQHLSSRICGGVGRFEQRLITSRVNYF